MLQVKYGLSSWPESLTPPVRSPFPEGKRIVSLKPPMYKQILENSQLVNWGLPMCLGTIGMRFMLSVWFVCLRASQSFLHVSVRHFSPLGTNLSHSSYLPEVPSVLLCPQPTAGDLLVNS